MLWKGERESDNVEDRRMLTPGTAAVGGGIGAMILGVIVYFLGGDPRPFFNQDNGPGVVKDGGPPIEAEKDVVAFVRVVLASTEDVWEDQFRANDWGAYKKPTLVLFRQRVKTENCGLAESAVGPFYCPGDQKVYLDLSFFGELRTRFKAPGEFAQAYVIAHEVGHHIQTLRGTSKMVHAKQGSVGKVEANRLSVRLELQADFFAGVWAHHANKKKRWIQPGDIEAALMAAKAIGDDALQKQARGFAVPDSFTHGTSDQRIRWFRRGFDTGDVKKGDTFGVNYDDL